MAPILTSLDAQANKIPIGAILIDVVFVFVSLVGLIVLVVLIALVVPAPLMDPVMLVGFASLVALVIITLDKFSSQSPRMPLFDGNNARPNYGTAGGSGSHARPLQQNSLFYQLWAELGWCARMVGTTTYNVVLRLMREAEEQRQRELERSRLQEQARLNRIQAHIKMAEEQRKTEGEKLRNIREELRRMEAERKGAEEEKKRMEVEKKRAEEERKRAEEERKRAEEERKRAEEGRKRAEEERKRAKEERKRVEEEGKRAEEERKRVEAERKRMEAERKRMEAERKRAEEERKRAEEERKRAEEERKRAEEERKRAEEERKRAEGQRQQQQRQQPPRPTPTPKWQETALAYTAWSLQINLLRNNPPPNTPILSLPPLAILNDTVCANPPCRSHHAELGLAICTHTVNPIMVALARSREAEKQDVLKMEVRQWHPDKFQQAMWGDLVRKQTNELTAVLTGLQMER